MEIEQPTSRFRKAPLAKTVLASQAFDASNNRNSPVCRPANKSGEIIKKILSNCYQQLDYICGNFSYFFLNYPNDFFEHPWQETLQLLLAENIAIIGLINERYNDCPFFYRLKLSPLYNKDSTDGIIIKFSIGHGFGKNAEVAFFRAVGEFLERYFLTLYRKKDLLRGSLKDFQKRKIPAIDLNFLAGFSEEQKKNNSTFRFNEKSNFYWEKAKRWSTGETVYLPAQLIYWNYICQEAEPFLAEPNTNGAGGFFTKEGAILSGLYELIQRDSFLIYWLNQLTPKAIDPRTVPHDGFQSLLKESERYGFEIYCLNITTDTGVPAFATVLLDPSGKGPCFCLGAGCEADPAKALYKALEESWSVYYWMRPLPPYPVLNKNYKPFQEKIKQDERLRIWSDPKMKKHLEFFISGKKESFKNINFNYPKEFISQSEELDFLIKRIESLGPGYEIYYYQANHRILSKIGYHSVQVIIPRFVPLYIQELNAPLGTRRIKEAPEKFGFKPAEKLNPLPHLFP